MTINSVMSHGLTGMRASQREMLQAAEDIASAALPLRRDPGTAPSADVQAVREAPTDLVEPLVELKRQEHLFTASAKVVSIADETLGSLIDVTS